MTIRATLTTVRDFIVDNISGFTTDNCSVNDEEVFQYIQLTNGAETKCCIVSSGEWYSAGSSEFRSTMIDWAVTVNGFFMAQEEDYADAFDDSLAFTDAMITAISQDPTMGGEVMAATVRDGGPPLSFKRGNFFYIIAPMVIIVRENIS